VTERTGGADRSTVGPRIKSPAIATLLGALAAAVFLLDTVTDREIAVAVFYVMIVLLSVRVVRQRGVMLIALGCALLTVLSYALNDAGSPQAGFVNCVISLAAIAVTAYLAIQMMSANSSAQEARAHLAHSARLNALGELTASIAHEVNQPLTAIATSADACARWLSLDVANLPRARKAIERIVDDAHRASEIVGRVRGLATRGPLKKEWTSINEIITEVLTLTARELRETRVEVHTTLADNLPLVFVDRVQVQQVLLNLILNGMDAINTSANGVRQLQVLSDRDATGLRVAVRDTGPGFAPEDAERLFEPFFTTKGAGLGMGLTISRSIIETHGGYVRAESAANHGATFEFTLPVGTVR
jgi:C4-dicarboxylate-specific signal transduction histidine kinase